MSGNRQIVLAARPDAAITAGLFALREVPLPAAGPGQILMRNQYLSIEPGTVGAIRGGDYLVPTIAIGQVLNGFTVGTVLESRVAGFREGDAIRGYGCWQEYGLLTPSADSSKTTDPRHIDANALAAPVWLGALGLSGFTAYIGTQLITHPAPGETFVIAAAAGAVGISAVQYAQLAGARIVAIAGGAAKRTFLRNELGLDCAIDHQQPDFVKQLTAATPSGIDIYFENVGGAVLDAVWPRMNTFGRIALCGMVSQYGLAEPPPGPNLFAATVKRLSLTGFMGLDPQHLPHLEAFERSTIAAIRAGRFRHREDIVAGIENAPQALVDVLSGNHLGKRLIRLC